MRKAKGLILSTALLSATLAVSGCMSHTGDVGNKNIRPNSVTNARNGNNNWMNMRMANDQHNEMNRMYGERRENNNIVGMHGNSKIELSDVIANKVAAMPGVHSAYVMMGEHNAYVAVGQGHKGMNARSVGGGDLSGAMKDKIADKVKTMSPSIDNVYVSTNPDFVGRMQGFSESAKAGHPIQGFLSEFNAVVERVFPEASGARDR